MHNASPSRRSFHRFAVGGLVLSALPTVADERLADIACRSVHLAYESPAASGFCCEVTPRKSAAGTYFMVCGWNTGYFGLQELGDGRKVVLFSVWDPGKQNDPKLVDEKDRVAVVEHDEDVRIGRFGNEGTGGQSFYDLDWKLDAAYRLAVTAEEAGKRTNFAGYLWLDDAKKWKKLVTFSRVGGWQPLRGHYSFIEDFRRNRKSAAQARVAEFGPAWVRPVDGEWQTVSSARFTADSNPATNIDAGVRGERFYLATGGDTHDEAKKLKSLLRLDTIADAPDALESLK